MRKGKDVLSLISSKLLHRKTLIHRNTEEEGLVVHSYTASVYTNKFSKCGSQMCALRAILKYKQRGGSRADGLATGTYQLVYTVRKLVYTP